MTTLEMVKVVYLILLSVWIMLRLGIFLSTIGPYGRFFDSVHGNIEMVEDFDISLVRQFTRLNDNIEIPILS